jgi:hypothetical protein
MKNNDLSDALRAQPALAVPVEPVPVSPLTGFDQAQETIEFKIVRNADGTLTRKDCLYAGTLYRIERQSDGWHMFHRSDAHPEWLDWGRTFQTERGAINYMASGMIYTAHEQANAWVAAVQDFLGPTSREPGA